MSKYRVQILTRYSYFGPMEWVTNTIVDDWAEAWIEAIELIKQNNRARVVGYNYESSLETQK